MESRIDLWYVPTSDIAGDDLIAACRGVLSAEERRKETSFVFAKNRHEYLVTRALSRAVLARHFDVPPQALAFRRNDYGRPELLPPGDLKFNLTNTVELVACAVTYGREVGVDAEPLTRAGLILDVAETVFSARERGALAAVHGAARETFAVRLWTLKEAYMKARGMGMSLAPQSFELDLDAPRIGLSFITPNEDDPARWELSTREIEGHVIGTCVELLGATSVEIVPRRADLRALLNRD